MPADNDELKGVGCNVVAIVIGVVLAIMTAWMGIMPWYWVYHQRMEGEAELAKAEYSKQVAVQTAKAKLDSAKLLADAEVERAKGVAKANEIIGKSLENNPEYLTWLWLEGLREGTNEVIYIPTEAGIPIFDAGGRFQSHARKRPASTDAHAEAKRESGPAHGAGSQSVEPMPPG